MEKKNMENFINGVRNDIKISIDDIFDTLEIIIKDIEELKSENDNQR